MEPETPIVETSIAGLDPIIIGLLSSVATELFKFFPFLGKNELTRAITAIAITVLGTYLLGNGITDFPTAITSALVSYKVIVQPLAKSSGIKTQS